MESKCMTRLYSMRCSYLANTVDCAELLNLVSYMNEQEEVQPTP